ncbi:MAG: hypothetical protein EBE86_004570 [Hormoscilla sp. GUM202]|nr:hypothetical protein [Hormoscilla sp. GM7CHS1pb]MBO1346701.1 hypothetical protein [Hormoscilla sp. GUM202]
MNYRKLTIALFLLAASLAPISCGQNPGGSSVDKLTDYYRNDTPVKGTTFSPLMPGSLWRVVASQLNCYTDPLADSKIIITQFSRNDIIQAEVWRGGADEVLVNELDSEGKPWMHIRGGRNIDSPADLTRCYVRANSRYIQPVKN